VLPPYQEVSARILTVSAMLGLFNAQYMIEQVQNTMTISLRIDSNPGGFSVIWRGLDTFFTGPQVSNIITPNMTSAACDTLAQTMLNQIAAAYPGTQ
jgi:hypothetical protein